MLILGIETSTRQVGVALGEATDPAFPSRAAAGAVAIVHRVTILAGVTAARDQRHAEALAPAVAFACRAAGVRPADVEALAVGLGPGLFTGLRVGVATAQAMALALDVPLVGVPTLDLVAHRVRVSGGPILVAMDARRGELFWAPYEPVPGGTPRRLGPDRADPPARVAEAAAELGSAVVVVGDGPERYPAAFGAVGLEIVGGPDGLPSAVAAVELGARALAEGRGGPAGSVVPTYVRAPDAAASWPERATRAEPVTPGPADPVGRTGASASPVVGGGRRRSA